MSSCTNVDGPICCLSSLSPWFVEGAVVSLDGVWIGICVSPAASDVVSCFFSSFGVVPTSSKFSTVWILMRSSVGSPVGSWDASPIRSRDYPLMIKYWYASLIIGST